MKENSRYTFFSGEETNIGDVLEKLLENCEHLVENITNGYTTNQKYGQYNTIEVVNDETKADSWWTKNEASNFKVFKGSLDEGTLLDMTEDDLSIRVALQKNLYRPRSIVYQSSNPNSIVTMRSCPYPENGDVRRDIYDYGHVSTRYSIQDNKGELVTGAGVRYEISNRLEFQYTKLFGRWLKSMRKFTAQVLSAIPVLFAENEELLASKLMWSTFKQSKTFRPVTDFTIIDGFIMEGKSQLCNVLQGFDSEFDEFWRSQMKGDFTYLPHRYYNIFILCGYASLVNWHINQNRTSTLVINRGWGSCALFANDIATIAPGLTNKRNLFTENFFFNLMHGLSAGPNFRQGFRLVVWCLSKYPMPTEFLPVRKLEQDLYSDNPGLYYRLAHMFAVCLGSHYLNGHVRIGN